MGDLPDYTKYIAAAPTPTPVGSILGTKAETVTHKTAQGSDTYSLTVTLPAPASGKKIGLIIVLGNTDVNASDLKIETFQSASWAEVLGAQFVQRDKDLLLVFPCWVPDQDVGDGSTETVRIVMSGTCSAVLNAFVLYYEE